ncbi:MAG: AraC family transcriptional regulator [Hyphomonas sp.]|nr:AraC family transcriptional regulator [Hyphomonas sp.]
MKYRELPPPVEAAPYVESLWLFEAEDVFGDAPSHVIVPDGALSLSLFRLPDGPIFPSFAGPALQAHKVPLMAGAIYAGVRLRPGTAGSSLREDVSRWRGAIGPLQDAPPALLTRLAATLPRVATPDELPGLLDALTRNIAAHAAPVDGPVRDLAGAIMQGGGRDPLGPLVARTGLSERHMRRRFAFQCGLSPKEFARLRRVRTACVEIVAGRRSTYAEASAEAGYADQAHMSRDFQSVFGNSVSLVQQYLDSIEHGALL